MDFWTRLKGEIRAKNTTQEWIANKIGVPFGTFRKWLNRKTYPNLKEGQEIAKLLDTSVEYLLTGVRVQAEPKAEPGIEGLSDTEQRLIKAYRKLSVADRENVILAVDAWAGKRRYKLLEQSADVGTGQIHGNKSPNAH
ncbi:MAG: helix-turn-helix domain-containing protein [Treponema sp.]|nr:helix-turn-helix domain-containing protein [Treponema sp.]